MVKVALGSYSGIGNGIVGTSGGISVKGKLRAWRTKGLKSKQKGQHANTCEIQNCLGCNLP